MSPDFVKATPTGPQSCDKAFPRLKNAEACVEDERCTNGVLHGQEPNKLVKRLQEQVVRSLQTSFREGQVSEFVKSNRIVGCSLQTSFRECQQFRISELFVVWRAVF